MGVQIPGERYAARVPEHLRHDFRLNAGGERERRSRVTVESEVGSNFAAFNARMKSCCATLRFVKGRAGWVVKISPLSVHFRAGIRLAAGQLSQPVRTTRR